MRLAIEDDYLVFIYILYLYEEPRYQSMYVNSGQTNNSGRDLLVGERNIH